MKKVVYVTGCLGFIGAYIVRLCISKGWYVIGVDKISYSSNVNLIKDFESTGRFLFLKEDINDIERLYDCDYIINCAAETHVDNSIENSDSFLHSNVNGVHHLLKLISEKRTRPILLHFSTDEVYGDIEEGSHTEKDLLKPSNPYSATKAAADMLIMAWGRTHNVPYVIVRPTNNYGIGQYVEKLIPKACKYLTLGRKIPLHQKGMPVRTWLHAKDTANAVCSIIESGKVNEIYNISGNYEEKNIVVANKLVDIYFGTNVNYDDFIDLNFHRQGQDVRYSIDDTKLKSLGWHPKQNFDESLVEIVSFYKENFIW